MKQSRIVHRRNIWLLIRYQKRKMLEVPTKVNLANYQNLCALDSKYPSLSDYDNPIIKSIGRLPITLFGSNTFVDIVKEVK